MTEEIKCEDCPKAIHSTEIKELKTEMQKVKGGVFKLLLSVIGSVIAICAVILTGIGMADNNYQKAALLNQQTASSALELHKQQTKAVSELKEYQDQIDMSVETVRDFRGTLNRMEDEWHARKRNEDYIMKQLYEISAKLEKEK